jgi:hypothetical protein
MGIRQGLRPKDGHRNRQGMSALPRKGTNGDCKSVMDHPDLKHCPICDKDLPVSEFGICRARKDGRNLYCMSCIREKVRQSRVGKKNWRQVQKAKQVKLLEQLRDPNFDTPILAVSKLSPVERVKEAIHNGARTQKEIFQQTKLGKDEIGDAIAHLLLWTNEIETKSDGDNRYYFIRKVHEQPKRKDSVLSLNCFGPVIKHERVA